jgi:hypothetical protein
MGTYMRNFPLHERRQNDLVDKEEGEPSVRAKRKPKNLPHYRDVRRATSLTEAGSGTEKRNSALRERANAHAPHRCLNPQAQQAEAPSPHRPLLVRPL